MTNIITLNPLQAFTCTRDKDRAKQFKRIRKANMKARRQRERREER